MDIWNVTWPWYVSGPIIALVMFILTFLGHSFGVSANLRTMCSITGLGNKISFFNFHWKAQSWNLVFLGGALAGGILTQIGTGTGHEISESTLSQLISMGFTFSEGSLLPNEMMLSEGFGVTKIIVLFVGGILIGFGSSYAGGCTSGHAISGLSNLQLPSLIAVVGFFVGGLVMSFFLLPFVGQFLTGAL